VGHSGVTYPVAVIRAILIWSAFVLIALGLWVVTVLGTESAPANPALAQDYYRWMANSGAMSKSTADEKIKQEWLQFLTWSTERVRWPVVVSTSLIYPLSRWARGHPDGQSFVDAVMVAVVAGLISIFVTFPLLK